MVRMKRCISYAATLGLVLALAPQARAEGADKATQPAAKKKAAEPAAKKKALPTTTTRAAGPKDLLEAIPDEAWGFAAIPSLNTFDTKLGGLFEKLNFPIGSPVEVLTGLIGIADGLRDQAGVGLVVLNPMEFGMPSGMLVLLIPTTDAEALLEAFDPEDAGEGIMKIDVMGEQMYAALKGGFVAVGPDKSSVQFVAEAKKGIRKSLKPDQVARYKKADLFAMVNLRPAIELAKPFVSQAIAMFMVDSMDEDPDKGEEIQQTAQEIVDLLDEINTLEIALGLDDAGLQLSFFLTFKEGGTIAKKIAADKGAPSDLLAGLPKDEYIMAMGVKGFQSEEEGAIEKGLISLLMSQSEVGKILDKAKFEELRKLGKQLQGKTGSTALSVSVLPEGSDGMLALTGVLETSDVKGTIELSRKLVGLYKEMFKQEDVAKILSGLTCKADAEKVGDVSVDHIILDLSAAAAEDEEMKGMTDMLEKLLGKEGLLMRLAPAGDKRVVVTLGGGSKRLAEVLKAAAGKGSLAEDAGIMKVRKKLPKRRMFELYLSVDQLLKIVKAIVGSEDVPVMEKIDAPLGISVATGKNHGRLDLVVPTELIVEIKNVVLQAMLGGGFGGDESPEPAF